jgi:hypothetical protein
MKLITTLRAVEPDRPSVPQPDSVEKIVKQLALLSSDTIVYSGYREVTFDKQVDKVVMDASMFNRFTCIEGCSACCLKFTLDYLPSEMIRKQDGKLHIGFHPRVVTVNGRSRCIWTNDQTANRICDFLRVPRGDGLGCAHWPLAPLSCASAPQFQVRQFEPGVTTILKGPFKDTKTMHPTPQCEFTDKSASRFEDHQLVKRFQAWADYLSIKTCLEAVDVALGWGKEAVVWSR